MSDSNSEPVPVPIPANQQPSGANELPQGQAAPRVPEGQAAGDQAAPSLNGANPFTPAPTDPSLPAVKKLPDWR